MICFFFSYLNKEGWDACTIMKWQSFYFSFIKIFFNVYLFLREREREREKETESRGGTEREGDTESEADPRLHVGNTYPDVGLEIMNREIMTWAEVGCLTDWASQVSRNGSLNVYSLLHAGCLDPSVSKAEVSSLCKAVFYMLSYILSHFTSLQFCDVFLRVVYLCYCYCFCFTWLNSHLRVTGL